jgi:cellulose biosynthesis protein BcsQ
MTDALKNLYPNLLLRSSIRKNIKFAEAQLEDKSIFEILDERGTKDYKNLCDEILIKIKYDQQK